MVTLRRISNSPYRCDTGLIGLESVANRVRRLPDSFMGDDSRSITPDFSSYALPLLGPDPFPRYGRLEQAPARGRQ